MATRQNMMNQRAKNQVKEFGEGSALRTGGGEPAADGDEEERDQREIQD